MAKIAFDLDDTLIPTTREFATGSSLTRFPVSVFFRERLRNGAISFLKDLSSEHELWIYTTSLRSAFYIKLWFLFSGVKIHRVINGDIHRKSVRGTEYRHLSKAPGLFGIDYLIDDSPGVAHECRWQSTCCITIHPQDISWQDMIINELAGTTLKAQ